MGLLKGCLLSLPCRPGWAAAPGAPPPGPLHWPQILRPVRQGSVEPESDCSQTVSPETLCSSLCSLEDGLLGSPAPAWLPSCWAMSCSSPNCPQPESAFRSLGPLEAGLPQLALTDPACLSPAEEEPAPCKDCQPLCLPPVSSWERQRQASDVASSGVVSLETRMRVGRRNSDPNDGVVACVPWLLLGTEPPCPSVGGASSRAPKPGGSWELFLLN